MSTNDRNGRDAAGMGPYARERESLTALSTLDSWTVSDGEPDIRGWEVRTVSGRQLGSVADLLVDADAGEVVLIDVDLPGSDRHTFVPIRVAQLDRERRLVLMDSADVPETDLVRADREVITERAALADSVPIDNDAALRDAEARDAEARAEERRRSERRRIDRVSSDL